MSLSMLGTGTTTNRPIGDAVDVSFTADSLVVTLTDGRTVSAPLEWFPIAPRHGEATAELATHRPRRWHPLGGLGRGCFHSQPAGTLKSAPNNPAPGNAGSASRLAMGHHRPGAPIRDVGP